MLAEHERHAAARSIFQLQYNHNRTALGRAISQTIKTLQDLQEENNRWPVHYPSVQLPPVQPSDSDQRPSLTHAQSSRSPHKGKATRPQPLQRAETSLGHDSMEESSAAAETRPMPGPRLVTPQLARDFSVLKIDLKMDGVAQTDIIHSMRKDSKALAQLLDGQVRKSVRHLSLLRERIEDTSSKVLVTGDLNSGKSTFCNALLRRKILPEDEQPCTGIFCEVLDVRDNGGVEEVHAITIGTTYNRNDESTYRVFPLTDLDKIVMDSEHYSQCKVYIKDTRTVDESLLNNGILDIALIDGPGLNSDSVKTTAVFARQEEIDVVVFVVSAANHFTISARDFIFDAAREKAYMFIVVNGFDNIKNKERCQEQILKQVAHLSPATFKESSDLVHFVSSNAVPVASADGPTNSQGNSAGTGSASNGAPGPPDDDDDPNDNTNDDQDSGDSSSGKGKGKGKDDEDRDRVQQFAEMETSLRRFVLEKRARSKLAPAKTYLLNVLDDLHNLAQVNQDVAQAELDRVTKKIEELEPLLEQSNKARTEARDALDSSTENAAAEAYAHTRDTLRDTIANISNQNIDMAYPGIWNAYAFAEDVGAAMLAEITSQVDVCEDYARTKTSVGVDSVRSLGESHLGEDYVDLKFQPENMFRRRKDTLARQVHISVEIWDFVDISGLWEQQEKVAGTSMAVTVAGVLGTQVIGGTGWIGGALNVSRVLGSNNLRSLLIPGLLAAFALGVSYAVASIPTSLPRRLSAKIAHQLTVMDFTHSNALRISSEVRKALKIPADNLRIGLQRSFEELQNRREQTGKICTESKVARKYFGNLVRSSDEIRSSVQRVDLDGPAPGIAGGYDF